MSTTTPARAHRRIRPRHVGRLVVQCISSIWSFVASVLLGGAIVIVVAWKFYGLYPVAVKSGSMEPTLPVGSLIWVHEVDEDRVAVGDIITFDAPGERIGRVTHRVVKIRTHDGHHYFETKGDANRDNDDWRKFMPAPKTTAAGVEQHWVKGVSYGNRPAVRYVWGVPYLGRVTDLADKPRLRVGALLGLLVAIGLASIAHIWAPRNRRESEFDHPGTASPMSHTFAASNIGHSTVAESHAASTPTLALRMHAAELVVRLHGEDRGVVDVHHVPIPDVVWGEQPVAAVVVRAYDSAARALEARFGIATHDMHHAPLQLGPLRAALATRLTGDEPLTTSMVADAVREAASELTREPEQRWLRSRLLHLITLHATLRHFGVAIAAIEADVSPPTGARRSTLLSQAASTGTAVIALFALTMVGATQASLSDTLAMASVQTTGDQLRPITGMTFTSSSGSGSTNLRASWIDPSGIPPSSFDFWRSTSPGVSTTGAPTANVVTSPWDVSLAQCNVFYYKSKSRFASMISAESNEFSWLHDGTPPVITDSVAVTVPGGTLNPVSGWARLGTFNSLYLYATVTDNCAPAATAITVTMDTTAIAATGSTTAPATFGSYTPISGGATYNFRVGPISANHAALVDGATPTWSITATVSSTYHSHAASTAGATFTVDGTSPSVTRTPVLIADKTNYFAPEIGSGAVARNLGFRLVGSFVDTGSSFGTGSIMADINNIATSATVELSSSGAPFSTENGVDDWTHRTAIGASAPIAKNIADGSQPITVTITDRVGNSTTSNITGRVDSTAPTLASCSNFDPGGADSILNNTDYTRLQFSEAIEPGSIVTNWNDGSTSRTGLSYEVWNAQFLGLGVLAQDFIAYTGTNLQLSAGANDTYALGSSAWSAQLLAGGHDDFSNSAVNRIAGQNGQRWELVYNGGAASFARPGGINTPAGETFRLRTSGTGAWDVAGNNVSTASIACPTLGW